MTCVIQQVSSTVDDQRAPKRKTPYVLGVVSQVAEKYPLEAPGP